MVYGNVNAYCSFLPSVVEEPPLLVVGGSWSVSASSKLENREESLEKLVIWKRYGGGEVIIKITCVSSTCSFPGSNGWWVWREHRLFSRSSTLLFYSHRQLKSAIKYIK